MPDLKSELQKLENLRFDDDVETSDNTTTEDTTVNLSKQIWEYVQQHPSTTSKQIALAMGLHNDQVSTRLTQVFKRGWISRKENADGTFRYFTTHKEYPAKPVKESLRKAQEIRRANIAAAKAKPVRKKAEKLSASRKSTSTPTPSHSFDLSKLSVLEARALYEELKKLFGGY